MKPRIPLTVLSVAVVSLLAACAVTRVEPPAPFVAAPQYKEAGDWQHAPAALPVPEQWWTLFGDPVLDDLQRRLVIGNETLKSAVAAVAGARAAYEASRSAMYPTLSAGLDATRSASPGSTAERNPGNSVSLSATASWEVDLWGRLSQASSGAQASLQASQDDLAAVRLSAQALLAQTYFSLRTADAQLALLDRSVALYQRSLDLTQVRYDDGVVARTDVLQARTQLQSAQAQAADLEAGRAQLEHALAVLLGVPPSALGLERNAALPPAPDVPPMLPSTLLERRPDIAAAQRRVAAAYAQIGVADAAWFPDLSLSASAGYRGASLARLVSAPNLLWSLGASVTEAVLDGGQRKLASAQARAAADQATAAYRQTVLTALQEVEDNLVLADRLQREAQFQAEALQAAQRNLEITLDQYRTGTVSYLNVVTAQTSALTSESSLLSVRNRQLAAVNQLLKNIAGRWAPA
ncbi:efflux transporter outer membrane subunit [Rhizobacter sp. Root1221]|uniref:efflux transporter outer membrane subunit n=1 Tax=Rhizobacter sp. Root1221 TaxID=1736433 RepID=UPI0006FC879B|nr:efflux transporter outer membrane subunit [Rhizobacter sp. Root1221]KQV78909.1 RND transporter [Rhizobacter sp. Root1221]